MSNVVIREALAEDAVLIAELEEKTFPIPWTEEAISHDIRENPLALVLVAESDGVFAGYADVWEIAGEAQLNNIAIDGDFRGRHIGQLLMEDMIERLVRDGNAELTLEVRPSNVAAISLYEKLGFETIGRRAAYYLDNGEDALIMRKEL